MEFWKAKEAALQAGPVKNQVSAWEDGVVSSQFGLPEPFLQESLQAGARRIMSGSSSRGTGTIPSATYTYYYCKDGVPEGMTMFTSHVFRNLHASLCSQF